MQTPSAAAEAAAAARELGHLRACERPRPLVRWLVIFLMLAALALELGGIAFVVSSIVDAHRHAWATDTGSLVTLDVFMALLAVGFALGARFTWSSLARWIPNPTVSLHERGLVYERGGAPIALAWNELDEVTFRAVRIRIQGLVRTSTGMTYRVKLRAGERAVVLTETLALTADALEIARRAISERVFPQALARLQSGDTLTFGPVAVSRDALRLRGRVLRWAELRAVDFDRGFFTAVAARRRFAEPVARIPNVDVLVALCHDAITTRR